VLRDLQQIEADSRERMEVLRAMSSRLGAAGVSDRYAIDLNVRHKSLKKIQFLSVMPDLADFLMKFVYIQAGD
jgi:hypothetical protein